MFRERKEMHIYMLKNSIFLTIESEKNPSGNIILLGSKKLHSLELEAHF